jgi:hypothetical protein
VKWRETELFVARLKIHCFFFLVTLLSQSDICCLIEFKHFKMDSMFYSWDIYCLIEFKHFKVGSMLYPWDICYLIEFKHFKMGSMFYPRQVNLSLGPLLPPIVQHKMPAAHRQLHFKGSCLSDLGTFKAFSLNSDLQWHTSNGMI